MARNDILSIPAGTWTEITNADASAITFQNQGTATLSVAATTGAAPSSTDAILSYDYLAGEYNIALAAMAPGIAATRVWVHSSTKTKVMVSHA